jgi:hypothetical protein
MRPEKVRKCGTTSPNDPRAVEHGESERQRGEIEKEREKVLNG